jgi:hypothetical protein
VQRQVHPANIAPMDGESERLRAELRRLYALLAWTQDEHAEDALVRRIEEAEERLQKIWNAANDR